MMRILVILLMFLSIQAQAKSMRLAVTTSFHNSGLSEVLLPQIEADTGLEVQLLVVGTGQALRLGEAGDVDAILVHSKEAEEKFVSEGHGTHRREIMYNDFVIIGPREDFAGVRNVTSAVEAFQRIAKGGLQFVSRGDDSGTHRKELALWKETTLDPTSFGSWYKAVGSGMGASLNTASAVNAYIMSDRASWLNFSNKNALELLFSGDPVLFNQYAYLPVNPQKHTHLDPDAAKELETWLTSPKAQALIDGYTINGEKLFVFNAVRED